MTWQKKLATGALKLIIPTCVAVRVCLDPLSSMAQLELFQIGGNGDRMQMQRRYRVVP